MPVSPSDYKLKVLLGLPFAGGNRYVPPEWAVALATIAWPMNCRYAFAPTKNLPREQARTEIVERALKHRAQYVAMLDDDVQPPADWIQSLVRELDTRPEFDVIAAVVPSVNREPMVFRNAFLGPSWDWKKGEVFEVEECATACIMIRTSVFAALSKPWFRDLNTMEECVQAGVYKEGEFDRGAMTDDIYFCTKARAAGHRMLAHGGVLPVHWQRNGTFTELDPESFPMRADVTVDANPRVNIANALKIEGWMTEDELLWLASEASRVSVKRIAEIGSWMGRSTRAFADNIGTDGVVYAIDTWEGSSECDQPALAKMPVDWIYDRFVANMADLDGRVKVVRGTSVNAAALAMYKDEHFDIVFIDAAHDYESVRTDIALWKARVRPGGLLCGHDYTSAWPGVVRAVDELIPGAKRGAGSIWYDVVVGQD